jgi:hypothetical protein
MLMLCMHMHFVLYYTQVSSGYYRTATDEMTAECWLIVFPSVQHGVSGTVFGCCDDTRGWEIRYIHAQQKFEV